MTLYQFYPTKWVWAPFQVAQKRILQLPKKKITESDFAKWPNSCPWGAGPPAWCHMSIWTAPDLRDSLGKISLVHLPTKPRPIPTSSWYLSDPSSTPQPNSTKTLKRHACHKANSFLFVKFKMVYLKSKLNFTNKKYNYSE